MSPQWYDAQSSNVVMAHRNSIPRRNHPADPQIGTAYSKIALITILGANLQLYRLG